MDFSKFRASGDLSDITIIVDAHEYKLHKFPLSAKSDYFWECARAKPGGDELFKVELRDFPGGKDIFEQVADFCYNMSLNLSKKNVVLVRCAAEYLKMSGQGNLKDLSSKFLKDAISSAKRNRSTSTIISMLMNCNDIGNLAQAAGVVDFCLEAFVECWMKPGVKPSTIGSGRMFSRVNTRSKERASAFTRIQAQISQATTVKLDESVITCLLALRADWFAQLITKARTNGISSEELGELAVRYITAALDKEGNREVDESSKDPLKDQERADSCATANDDEKDVDTNNLPASDETSDVKHREVTEEEISPTKSRVQFDIGTTLDSIISVLSPEAFNIPSVTLEWLIKTFRVATDHACECRSKLVRLIGEELTKLDPPELCTVSPSILHDIVVNAGDKGDDETSTRSISERVCKLVDTYLAQMAKEGNLTGDTFRLLASATKDYPRQTHDPLYNVLEVVMKSEKDTLTPEQRAELTDLVNFDLLSENSLQKALNEEMVPSSKIAACALKLCARMRSELASVKYIAEMQEEDFQEYQTNVTGTSAARSSTSPGAEPRHYTAFTSWQRNADSEPPNDSMEKSSSETLKTEDHDPLDDFHGTDPLKAAQNVLIEARHKLALPVYTGYRPIFLSHLSPPTSSGYTHLYSHHPQREHDISLEEELELRFDRSFYSLEPRVRQHRLLQHRAGANSEIGHRTYFPYSNYSHRY